MDSDYAYDLAWYIMDHQADWRRGSLDQLIDHKQLQKVIEDFDKDPNANRSNS